MKKYVVIVTLLMFAFVSGYAQKEMAPKQMKMKFMKELNLSDQQKEQFEKFRFDGEKKNIELRAKVETAKLDLRKLFTSDNLDKAAIEKKMNEVADAEVAIRMNRLNIWSETNKILNADQQKLWKKGLLAQIAMQGKEQSMRGRHEMKHEMNCPDCPKHEK